MQQSEPTFVETTTTEIDPLTQERYILPLRFYDVSFVIVLRFTADVSPIEFYFQNNENGASGDDDNDSTTYGRWRHSRYGGFARINAEDSRPIYDGGKERPVKM